MGYIYIDTIIFRSDVFYMEDFKRQIIDVLKDNDTVPPEGFTYFCEMLDWVLSIIKQDIEGGNDILSEDGLITYFDFVN